MVYSDGSLAVEVISMIDRQNMLLKKRYYVDVG
jgi:hypothetical protein